MKDKNIELRFIEFMPFDENKWSAQKMIENQEIISKIQERYGQAFAKDSDEANAVSSVYRIEGHASKIGFISSMS